MLHQNANPSHGSHALGIDVYHGNGPVNWSQVRQGGYSFAFIKASEGESHGGMDGRFHTNMDGAKAAGIVRGAYHFLRPTQSIQVQAERFLAQYTPATGDLIPSLDVDTWDGLGPEALRSVVAHWLEIVEPKIGKKMVVYANYDIGQHLTNVADRPLWIASFNSTPHVPPPWNGNWAFWQNSPSGYPSGTQGGNVDLDQFNGTPADLLKYCL